LLATEYIMGKIGSYPPAIQEKQRSGAAARSEMFRNAVQIGVKIAFGTDGRFSARRKRGNSPDDGLGMAPTDALRAATSVDAELLGISQTTARWKRKQPTSSMPGDPTVDITATERVLCDEGRNYREECVVGAVDLSSVPTRKTHRMA
jgi:hypothetical protein